MSKIVEKSYFLFEQYFLEQGENTYIVGMWKFCDMLSQM